jgi:hypothetical protein
MATYMVALHEAERQPVSPLMTTGRAAAAQRLPARIRLNAAVREGRRGWTAAESAAAVDTRASTVPRVRPALVEPGWAAALSRQRPTGRPERQREGAQAARRLACAGRAPPAGRAPGPRT